MTGDTEHRSSEHLPATEQVSTAESVGSDMQAVDAFHILRERYLTLVESTLAGTIYEDDPLRVSSTEKYDPTVREYGWDWPSKGFTMIGLRRLRNLRAVIESVIGTNVPGDIMETGVWRGGAGIMARAVLAAYSVGDRRVILADSFAGLPPPTPETYPADAGSVYHEYAELAVPLDEVKRNFAKFGLLDEQVVFLPGWFKDTLPTAPVERLAVLRLDGDMYESTFQALEALYDKVSINGWIVIDDYELVPACRAAVHDYFTARDIRPEIYPIDGVGVFFRKVECRDAADKSIAQQAHKGVPATPAAATLPGVFTPMNVDFVAWREALMAIVRASEAIALANQAARMAKHEAALANQAASMAQQVAVAARSEAVAARSEAVAARSEAVAAQSEAARLRRSLEVVYASRSWRLTRAYRGIGDVISRLYRSRK
jgi:O-methyltransferase